jgi:hypothetical protein
MANALPLYVGGGGVYAFDATFQVDEVAVYNAPLSAARVTAHYNAGITVPTIAGSGVVALSPLTAAGVGSFLASGSGGVALSRLTAAGVATLPTPTPTPTTTGYFPGVRRLA